MKKRAIVPAHTVRYFGADQHCSDTAAGDLILVATEGWAAKVIRFGERLRCPGADRYFAEVNHAMTALGDGTVQEMVGGGGVIVPLANYQHLSYAVVRTTSASAQQRAAAVEVARWYVGIPYGWGSVLADAIYLLLGIPIGLTFGQSVVCSADSTTAQRCLGLIPSKPDVAVLPSDLARWYGVRI